MKRATFDSKDDLIKDIDENKKYFNFYIGRAQKVVKNGKVDYDETLSNREGSAHHKDIAIGKTHIPGFKKWLREDYKQKVIVGEEFTHISTRVNVIVVKTLPDLELIVKPIKVSILDYIYYSQCLKIEGQLIKKYIDERECLNCKIDSKHCGDPQVIYVRYYPSQTSVCCYGKCNIKEHHEGRST